MVEREQEVMGNGSEEVYERERERGSAREGAREAEWGSMRKNSQEIRTKNWREAEGEEEGQQKGLEKEKQVNEET